MNWKRAASAAAVAVPIIALLGYGMTRDPKEIPSPLPGREAPTFSLAVFAEGQGGQLRPVGDTVRLADHSGEVVVLNFWASWCLACRDEHSTLSSVAEAYAGKGVKFYGVLYNDVPANGTRWISEMGGRATRRSTTRAPARRSTTGCMESRRRSSLPVMAAWRTSTWDR